MVLLRIIPVCWTSLCVILSIICLNILGHGWKVCATKHDKTGNPVWLRAGQCKQTQHLNNRSANFPQLVHIIVRFMVLFVFWATDWVLNSTSASFVQRIMPPRYSIETFLAVCVWEDKPQSACLSTYDSHGTERCYGMWTIVWECRSLLFPHQMETWHL